MSSTIRDKQLYIFTILKYTFINKNVKIKETEDYKASKIKYNLAHQNQTSLSTFINTKYYFW